MEATQMKTTPVTVNLRPVDADVLAEAAKRCGLSLPRFIEELAAVRASELRPVSVAEPLVQ